MVHSSVKLVAVCAGLQLLLVRNKDCSLGRKDYPCIVFRILKDFGLHHSTKQSVAPCRIITCVSRQGIYKARYSSSQVSCDTSGQTLEYR